jgi:hypothetical protein
MLAGADARQLPFADVIINPDVSGLPVIKVCPDVARKAIKAGEVVTRKASRKEERDSQNIKYGVCGIPYFPFVDF